MRRGGIKRPGILRLKDRILGQIPPDFTYTYEDGVYPRWLPASPDPDFEPDPYLERVGNPRDVLNDFAGELTILDAWDNPLRVVHPGRVASRNSTSALGPRTVAAPEASCVSPPHYRNL